MARQPAAAFQNFQRAAGEIPNKTTTSQDAAFAAPNDDPDSAPGDSETVAESSYPQAVYMLVCMCTALPIVKGFLKCHKLLAGPLLPAWLRLCTEHH